MPTSLVAEMATASPPGTPSVATATRASTGPTARSTSTSAPTALAEMEGSV